MVAGFIFVLSSILRRYETLIKINLKQFKVEVPLSSRSERAISERVTVESAPRSIEQVLRGKCENLLIFNLIFIFLELHSEKILSVILGFYTFMLIINRLYIRFILGT